MWSCEVGFPVRGFSTPPPNPPRWKSRAAVYSSLSEEIKKKKKKNKNKKNQFSSPDPPEEGKGDLFHVIHKVPAGNSPYVKAKQVQLIEKDPSRAISLFWKAINSGDRVDSALKDMAVVMKQLDRSDEAIEAIKSFRNLCTPDSQESLDNVLVELYKRSGRLEEQIDLLQYKLKCIDEGIAFGGKRTKTARSQGKKIQITLVQERSRLLGNLAWAHLQKNNFSAAEELYREALSLEEDMNKQCNLAICWMHMDRMPEARSLLNKIRAYSGGGPMEESYAKSFERACQVFCELESKSVPKTRPPPEQGFREVPCQLFPTPSKSPCKEGCRWVSRDWRDAHEEGTVCIDEHNRGGFLFRDQHLINDNLCEFGGQIKEVGHSENSKERIRSTYPRANGCWVNLSGIGDVSVTKRTHASPESIRGIEKFPVTEPARRTSSWESNNRPCNRKGGCRDASIRGANRKLSFDQSMSSGIQEVAALGMPQNTSLPSDGDWGRTWREKEAVIGTSSLSSAVVGATRKLSFDQVISSTQKAAALGTPKKCPPTIGDGGRRSIWRENEAVIDIMSQPGIVNGNWKRGSEFQIKEGVSVSSNGSWNNKDSEVPIKEDNLSGNGSVSGNGIAETLHERNPGNPKPTGSSSSAQENKKSWADMVEEDEKELCDEDPNENSWDWNNGDDELHNENLNFNIIHQNPSPGSDPENNLNRQLKALDVKDGGAVSSRNPSHYSLPHQTDQRFSSPPQALNLDGYTYVLASERECRGGSATTTSDMELWKRKRLPVFRDITLLPESPRA